jgi:type VI secretion system secreted protein VgrG
MPTYTQAERLLKVTTPLGPDALLLEGFQGVEAVSALFEFQLDLLAEEDTEVSFDKLLGQPVSIAVRRFDGSYRHFHGIVSRFSQGGYLPGPPGAKAFVRYNATVVPQVWLLTRRAQSRIFQQMSVPDILRQVLTGLDVNMSGIHGTFHPRDYCVQYRETDFDFISRLMEEEGIYYFFEHAEDGHKMVLANTPSGHPNVPSPATVIYDAMAGGVRSEERVYEWSKVQELRSGKYTLWDHCFELPHKHLEADKTITDSVQVGEVNHKLKLSSNGSLELYDWPGEYAQRFDGVTPGGGDRASDIQKIFEDNKRTVEIRIQQEAVPGLAINGASGCRQFSAGHKFTLEQHFNANGAYILTRVQHSAGLGGVYTALGDEAEGYRNIFTCIPAALPYRPQRVTPKPVISGTQTAVVVGPAGEEIFPDKYGRVKVQFHWDREGRKDTNSSCWVRVATLWAGKQWGVIHIPRIGQEVVVAFEEGDPDRPIIVGSVFNAEQMPPYTLPDNRTKSGVKSRSSLQGTEENFNEFRFEDKKGEEQVYLHAEKDFDAVIENNETRKVGFEKKDSGDQRIEVHNDQLIWVGLPTSDGTNPSKGNQSVRVWNNQWVNVGDGKTQADDGSQITHIWNEQQLHIGTGKEQADSGSQIVTIYKDRSVSLQTGNDNLAVSKGNRDVTIDMGNDKLTIKMGNQTTNLNLGASKTEAMQSIELKVGQSSITIDQMGVTIKGMMVKIEGQMMTEVKGMMTQVSGSAMLTCKGGITMIN